MQRILGHARPLCLSLFVLALVGCARNLPWRDSLVCADEASCGRAVIRPYGHFDLAFVEFTERGNVFDRDRVQKVLDHVEMLARQPGGVLAVVFTHGWKHNASPTDKNVLSFTEWLDKAARLEIAKDHQWNRRLIGIYIGWRGLSLGLGPLANVSYWDRKAVAHEVGKGGVTEFLLRLEHVLADKRADKRDENKNLSLVVGHSFGGAIVLTALNEIVLERVISADGGQPCGPSPKPGCRECFKTRPFGHGVVLLNPAIEANEALQLKEMVSQKCFAPNQSRLMHVISSDADQATNKAFRFGQWLESLRWSEARLERKFGDEPITFDESDLDTITVGNFKPFQTGQLSKPKEAGKEWTYATCVASKDCLLAQEDRSQHIPAWHHEPLAFIHTDKAFIEDHNDIFNNNVAAYLTAIVVEARFLRKRDDPNIPPQCRKADGDLAFGACFSEFLTIFGAVSSAAGKPGSP